MPAPGAFLSLSEAQVEDLLAGETECDRVKYLTDVLEKECLAAGADRALEVDTAWDLLHEIFADEAPEGNSDAYPLDHLVLRGESLCSDPDYLMILKSPEQVAEVASALRELSEEKFRERCARTRTGGRSLTDRECVRTWTWLVEVREFWRRAADDARSVLFTAHE